jgi:hypothetical protein
MVKSIPRRWRLAQRPPVERIPGGLAIRRYKLVPLTKTNEGPPKAATV